ncbi:MAG: hypothetical protein ACE5H7_10535 [Acidiferrobacterales bacterium]
MRDRAFEFALSRGDFHYRADTVNDLLNQSLPREVDDLTFQARGWTDDNAIDRGIVMNLRPTVADYQIHAVDEVWYKGKIQQIDEFLRARRPWYGFFREAFPRVVGALQGATLVATTLFLFLDSFAFAVVSGFMLAGLVWAFNAFLKGRIFPNTRIILEDVPRKFSYEALTLLFAVLTFVVTAVGFVVQVVK